MYFSAHRFCFTDYCDDPIPPINGYIDEHLTSKVGFNITYKCNWGYAPFMTMNATCNEDKMWYPAPEKLNCTEGTRNY